jgi:DNA mismatch endonuclease (patch repair protein)
MDALSPEQRGRLMGRVGNRNTGPELTVRRLVYSLGYRYRLHARNLPGRPDLVFTRRRKVVFVHGCFWHRHDCKRGNVVPKTRTKYWLAKFRTNVKRDAMNNQVLKEQGWKILTIWECELTPGGLEPLKESINGFLQEE